MLVDLLLDLAGVMLCDLDEASEKGMLPRCPRPSAASSTTTMRGAALQAALRAAHALCRFLNLECMRTSLC